MIKVKEYRGHIRNWEELCERLDIPLDLTREEREEQILVKAYETWGNEMADHMHGMFAFALWDESEEKLFCLRDQFGTKPFYYYETADGKLLYGTTIRKIMEQPGIKRRDASALFKPYLCGGRKYIFPRSEKAASGPVSCMAERKAYDRALLDASVSSGQ